MNMKKNSDVSVEKNKKYTKKPMRSFFIDLFLIAILAAAQIVLICFYVYNLYVSVIYIEIAFRVVSVLVVIYIINKRESNSYKLAWSVPILMFPAFGGILYIICQGRLSIFRFKRRIEDVDNEIKAVSDKYPNLISSFAADHPEFAPNTEYLNRNGFPLFDHTDATYFPNGESMYASLLEELAKAEKYIFIEFFIVHEGVMWNTILDLLVQKVKDGVDVRMLYDGMGSITTLPRKYNKYLESLGIKCKIFNRFVPAVSTMQNNRDHRKIVAIDGKVAYTGGVNLSDEYINVVERFGHWKDAAILVKGAAAAEYTLMFLRNWNIFEKNPESPANYLCMHKADRNIGYFQPYCDSPFDDKQVARNVYLNLINRANHYIYIMTPYLILDEELDSALKLAAESGVDVRIITPHHADKVYVHIMTRNSYAELIKSGVKIYEYEPGFLHSKNILTDDRCAVVGSVNFDYRSLYLHFECAQLFYDHPAIKDLKKDFEDTFKISIEITENDCRKDKGFSRIFAQLLKLFSPLF
ncbi:MAG: cardiolipin synthase [Clostridiales bacterium]|nr:cardiolipin synthase [Clostridiales bacterium]